MDNLEYVEHFLNIFSISLNQVTGVFVAQSWTLFTEVSLGPYLCSLRFWRKWNIISNSKHPIVVGLPWFKLHNLKIDRRNRAIKESPKLRATKCHRKSTPKSLTLTIVEIGIPSYLNNCSTEVWIFVVWIYSVVVVPNNIVAQLFYST